MDSLDFIVSKFLMIDSGIRICQAVESFLHANCNFHDSSGFNLMWLNLGSILWSILSLYVINREGKNRCGSLLFLLLCNFIHPHLRGFEIQKFQKTETENPVLNSLVGFNSTLMQITLMIFIANEFKNLFSIIFIRNKNIIETSSLLGFAKQSDTESIKASEIILTETEIKEFRKGIPIVVKADGSFAPENIPFDKNFEIDPYQIKIDDTNNIQEHEGFYSLVYKGMLHYPKPRPNVEVHVKTNKPDLEKSDFKNFLKELKTLSFVGHHDNLVSLMGAWTRDVSEGKLVLVTQYCSNGSLQDYLHSLTKTDSLIDGNQNEVVQKASDKADLSIKHEMFRWSYEIACGMEYLHSQNILHGSLSTRKVFLTSNNTAKLTEFGIAPYLPLSFGGKYKNDNDKSKNYWPWRNLAYESLKSHQFDSKSDVWSFSITLWEVYTFGSIPYKDSFETYCPEFCLALEKGIRPNFPDFIKGYQRESLQDGLSLDPSSRPDFKMLLSIMYKLTRPKRRTISFSCYLPDF